MMVLDFKLLSEYCTSDGASEGTPSFGKLRKRRLSEWFGMRVVDEEQKELALHRIERRPGSLVVFLLILLCLFGCHCALEGERWVHEHGHDHREEWPGLLVEFLEGRPPCGDIQGTSAGDLELLCDEFD
ncbi:hypothetical protein [Variovorax paradoxus]|uniref:hypothetical protein n=1 Tax=Variovorax paradoxus TaxID=34073 RepID=UPI001E61FD87|nr:hypothetical protein [Variovorax paradoxus]